MSRSLRFRIQFAVLAVILPIVINLSGCNEASPPANGEAVSNSYLMCFWNLENFFDDREDPRLHKPDTEYDVWFARNPAILQEKLDHLSKAIVAMNDGKGPDILACAEVESERAAELLREALNKRLSDPKLHYSAPLFKEISAGRHIAPAILTRLAVQRNRTQFLGRNLRILESHIAVNGHDLVLIASHWTSHVSDDHGGQRDKYADQIYGRVKGMYLSNPSVDVLVCGDFNDTPDADSVTKHLHAGADIHPPGDELRLFNLMAGKDPSQFGTHYYHSKWLIFDHLVVSPGMLDRKGWSGDADSVHVVRTLTNPHDRHHRPWRFGNEHDKGERGYSDHFPVTVRLHVEGSN